MKKIALLALFIAVSVNAQYFNSNAFQIPMIGWMGMDTTAGTGILRPNPDPNPWPSSDQLQIGLGYQYALSGYNLWWLNQFSIGLGYARNTTLSSQQVLTGMTALTGLRYNFLTLAWRPFIMGGVGLTNIFMDASNANGARAWMNFQAGPGIEWIFTDEMSIQLETGALVFLDFQRDARFSYVARLSYLIYF